jgi:membrane associated rhomboid family serine protease
VGLYDRDYTRADFQSHYPYAPQMRMAFPRPTPAVKYLLLINIVVFLLQKLGADDLFTRWFSVFPYTIAAALQVWRLVTYQFLHGGTGHILFNMIGLYFLGPTLERHWGLRRFVKFYLGCGIAGGLFYIVLAVAGALPAAPMVGASGAILGMLAACAILFPQFVVFFLFFPVPIRVAAVILIFLYSANLLTAGPNAGGDAAHLAGMAAGAAYVFSQSWLVRIAFKLRSQIRQKKLAGRRDLQVEVDRILEKVHNQGIHSLSSKEKRTLRKATRARQVQNGYN